jgi:hypothetical protein
MVKCYFVSDQNDIDVGDHKYVTGEYAVAEMCNMFCRTLGRGHVHIVPCGKTDSECNHPETGKIRHQRVSYGPDPEQTKDEVQHDEFWRLIDFDDPSLKADIDIFDKCPFFCGSEEHNNETEHKYCQLDLWHNKVKDLVDVGVETGFVSSDGHYFECIHQAPNTGYHFFFCMDDSGSMSGTPWFDLQNAATDFCTSRKQSAFDRLTMVQFNGTPQVMCQNLPMGQFDPKVHLVFRGGGTLFAPAISTCHQLIRTHSNTTLIPIFVFMSDGGAEDGDRELTAMNQELQSAGLKCFFIAFGCSLQKLQSMAALVKGSYLNSINGLALKSSFLEISSKFSTTVSVIPSCK